MKRKFFAAVLCALMVLALLPCAAFAAGAAVMPDSAVRIAAAQVNITFSSNVNGRFYWKIVPQGSPAPEINTESQTYGVYTGSGEKQTHMVSLSSMKAEQAYDVYIVIKDENDSRNISAPVKLEVPAYITPDTDAPEVEPGVGERTDAGHARVSFTSDEDGRYYIAVTEAGAGVPEIDASGAGTACVSGEETTGTVSGLDGGKAYDVYVVVKDAAGNVSAPVKFELAAWSETDNGTEEDTPGVPPETDEPAAPPQEETGGNRMEKPADMEEQGAIHERAPKTGDANGMDMRLILLAASGILLGAAGWKRAAGKTN